MKLDQLRKIIREEVKAAVKEELQDMLNEAVKAASTPDKPTVQEFKTYEKPKTSPVKGDPIMEMINQTKSSMTNEDYKTVFTGNSDMVQKPNFASMMASNMGMVDSGRPAPGLDISQFDFVKKAGEVYKASVEKDKQKYGIA
tara:strand:- start:715 stop:1140 length:426 start_codon:yes stop_codon:yes gene_type:complete